MTNYYLLILFYIATFYHLSTTTVAFSTCNASISSPRQPFDSQFDTQLDIQHSIPYLDQIQDPANVQTAFTDNHDNRQLSAFDHVITVPVSASVKHCRKLGGKMATATSYLLEERPWRQWQQTLSHVFHDIKTRFSPMFYNHMVKTIGHPSMDTSLAVQVYVQDWWNFPFLEWRILKSNLVGLWNRYYTSFLNWYPANDWQPPSYLTIDGGSNSNDDEFEPDQHGCYYDVLGTMLCVDQEQLLDDNGLNKRVNELFDAMTYEERTYTLRFRQRFTQWATRASALTADAMDRAQSIWLQHTQTIYRFLDDALSLDTCMDNNELDDHGHQPTATNQINVCPPVVFPFSTSPFDTCLEPTFFSFGNQSLPLRSSKRRRRTTTTLTPIRQPWTACSYNTDKNQHYDADDHSLPDRKNISLPQQLLDPYNKIQYQYLLTRLQNEMMKQLERLDKMLLQEYYRAMVTAPQPWTLLRPQQPTQKMHVYKPGYASQQLYQELRFFISISLRQLYKRSIQQLMDAIEQYDDQVMQQVQQAYGDIEWIKQVQSRHLFTFYPLHDYAMIPENKSTTTTSFRSSRNIRAIHFIGKRADWALHTHRKTVLDQWKTIFESMEQRSDSLWLTAIDQAQRKRHVRIQCDDTCIYFLDFFKIFLAWLFLNWAQFYRLIQLLLLSTTLMYMKLQ